MGLKKVVPKLKHVLWINMLCLRSWGQHTDVPICNNSELTPVKQDLSSSVAGRRLSSQSSVSRPRSVSNYVYIYGMPHLSKTPVVVGFRTGSSAAPNDANRSKISIAVSTGMNFSGFHRSDVRDVVNLPYISRIESNRSEIGLYLDGHRLTANTDYEFTLLALTSSEGTPLSSIVISWSYFNSTTQTWLILGKRAHDPARVGFLSQDFNLAQVTARSSSNSFSGSSLVTAWQPTPSITAFFLEIRMNSWVSGIVSVMPFPPSLWSFDAKGRKLYDGIPCPTGNSTLPGLSSVSEAASCVLRARGHHVNSVDLWFLASDLSQGVTLTIFLPSAAAASAWSWFLAYREFGSSPGYLVAELGLPTVAQAFSAPKPQAFLNHASTTYTGSTSTINLSIRPGVTLINAHNARIDVHIQPTAFRIDPDGCSLSSYSPARLQVLTWRTKNVCTLTMRSSLVSGQGTVQVNSDGTVQGTSVDFSALGVIGLSDPENTDGNSWHYLNVADHRYIIQTRRAAGQGTIEIDTSAHDTLVGSGTQFETGSFGYSLEPGDQIQAEGRTLVVVQVHNNTRCTVTEGGNVPNSSLTTSNYVIKWKSRLRVIGFFEDQPVLPTAPGSYFYIETFASGEMYWNQLYYLTIIGTNAAAAASSWISVSLFTGKDSDRNRQLDSWNASYSAGSYRVMLPYPLTNAVLHLTTVSSAAQARVILAFETAFSRRFSGAFEENNAQGMVLRISTRYPTNLRILSSSGDYLATSVTENQDIDCSSWILEVWSNAAEGFPHPLRCWWDNWHIVEPAAHIRFQAKNGLKMRTQYEIVFLAMVTEAANSIQDLIKIQIIDGDGLTYLNEGHAGIMKTVIPQPTVGSALNEPIIRSVEVLNGTPLQAGSLMVRLRSAETPTNRILANNVVRIFLFPLTAWHVEACSASRSDGSLVSCQPELLGRTANTLRLSLDQNSAPISNDSIVVFTVTGVRIPSQGFFHGELGIEIYNHPRETTVFVASYLNSASGRLSSNNFMSAPVSGGKGRLLSHSAFFVQEVNDILLIYQPSATCLSSAQVKCQLLLTAPETYRMLYIGTPAANSSENMNSPTGMGILRISSTSCQRHSCKLHTITGFTMWADVQYGVHVRVENPFRPMARDATANVWSAEISGSYRWGFGKREVGTSAFLSHAGAFAVLGRLQSASIFPDSLACNTWTQLHVQFVTLQSVPPNGTIQVEAPQSFRFIRRGTTFGACSAFSRNQQGGAISCSANSTVVIIKLGAQLRANTFCSFALEARMLPVRPESQQAGFYRIFTASSTTFLDAAAHVSWTAEVNSSGSLRFPYIFPCYQHELQVHMVVGNQLPYSFRLQAANVTVTLRLNQFDMGEVPLDVRVYAPAGYQWQPGSLAFPSSLTSAPLILWPDLTSVTGTELRLLAMQPLHRDTAYTFAAPIQVPRITPGSGAAPQSGNAWYVVLGTSAIGDELLAAGRAVVEQPNVQSIYSTMISSSNSMPLATAVLTILFSTVTPLVQRGCLLLTMPEGYSFGERFGNNCSTEKIWDLDLTTSQVPTDATMFCMKLVNGLSAFRWSIGSSGLSAGKHAAAVVVQNPTSGVVLSTAPSSGLLVETFYDDACTQVADVRASLALPPMATQLPAAELVIAYVDPSARIFDARPSRSTWIVFAFELTDDLESTFSIKLHGPRGFVFSETCSVDIGNGTSYSPLGNSLSVLPPSITHYALFPALTNATCSGKGNLAEVRIFPAILGSRSNFPAIPGRQFLFRVQAVNPPSTPIDNDWLINVAGRQYGGIPGYELWEFRAFSVSPGTTAAEDTNLVEIRFWNKNAIKGLRAGTHYGVIVIYMPEGFLLRSSGSSGSCVGFNGVKNISALSAQLIGGISCESSPANMRHILLKNEGHGPLLSRQYALKIMVQNPSFPVEAQTWQISSYNHQNLLDEQLLDQLATTGFAVNPKLKFFTVTPHSHGLQISGQATVLKFSFILTDKVLSSDVLVFHGPREYVFEAPQGLGICNQFTSKILPQPGCNDNIISFAFTNVSSRLEQVIPFGLPGATVFEFQLQVVNPLLNPTTNTLEVRHCRGTMRNLTILHKGACPSGGSTVSSLQHALWPIIPHLRSVGIVFLTPIVAAQGKVTSFSLKLRAVSAGAVQLLIESAGMDFSRCTAELSGVSVQCTGNRGSGTLRLQGNQEIPTQSRVSFLVRQVVNTLDPGPTLWSVTTFGFSTESGGVFMLDQLRDVRGFTVLNYISPQPVVQCNAQYLLNPTVPAASKRQCTSLQPWYQHQGNIVFFRFEALHGIESLNAHYLLVQPPTGFTFPSLASGGATVKPLTGFPDTTLREGFLHNVVEARNLSFIDNATSQFFSAEVLLIFLRSGPLAGAPFSFELKVNNPGARPSLNLWRVMLLTPSMTPLYTNDGDWNGFALYGTFESSSRTGVQWLVSNFPSESNVVRLRFVLMSSLAGQALKLRVVAPQGFAFDVNCLPSDPDAKPQPGINGAAAARWISSCVSERGARNQAVLSVALNLQGGMQYETNLLITNSAIFQQGAVWQLYTFKNNDLLSPMHYTSILSFELRIMEAFVVPEVEKVSASSFVHIFIRPQRDLGPHGQIVIYAPSGYSLFCQLRPFFFKGTLPNGVQCSAANHFAVLSLSGADFLEENIPYRFAVGITNPSASDYLRLHRLYDVPPYWTMHLQTRDRELVHANSQVAGYAPMLRSITRFAVASSTMSAGQSALLNVQFKLETELLQWRDNRLSLQAPDGFSFTCANTLARESYVLPSQAVLSAGLQLFQDIINFLMQPPLRGMEAFRNDGTTEDGRAIVDCSQMSRVSLAVSHTDASSFGRFAFRISVQNALIPPMINMWTLSTFSGGQLMDRGAAAGYEVANSTVPINANLNKPLSGACQVNFILVHALGVMYCIALCLFWEAWN